jgi:hypothetical protein
VTEYEARQLIETKRQETLTAGVDPYAVILDTELYALFRDRWEEIGAEVIVHDYRIREARGGEDGVLWWDQHDYEEAEDAWRDVYAY